MSGNSDEPDRMARRPRRRGARKPLTVYLDPAVLAWLQRDAEDFDMTPGEAGARLIEMMIMWTRGVIRLEDLPAPKE